MKQKKLMYIVSDIQKALGFEWIAPRLSNFFELSFILIGPKNSALSLFLLEKKIKYFEISDLDVPSNIKKALLVGKILFSEKPDIIHSHNWRGNLLSQLVAPFLGIKKRVYSRHHATIHYTVYPSGRKWDLLVNTFVTDIVAISRNVHDVLIEMDRANPKKITIIRHGFDLNYFLQVSEERIRKVRDAHGIHGGPVIGVIARYLELKGIQHIIPAFEKLLKHYPKAFLVLANTKGNYAREIKTKLTSVPAQNYAEIEFEDDLAALYQTFDIYVHVPVAPEVEAFGQTYIEALAAGVPSIFTHSGVAPEFIVDGFNALVVPYKNSNAIEIAMTRLIEDPDLQERLIANGRISVTPFGIEGMISELCELYNR